MMGKGQTVDQKILVPSSLLWSAGCIQGAMPQQNHLVAAVANSQGTEQMGALVT